MRYVRILGLSLAALFAVVAYATSSASALPEWGKCEAKAGGKYSDANCTKKAKLGTGTFEFVKQTKHDKFSGGNVGSGGVLKTNQYYCSGGSDEGKRVPAKKCEEAGGKAELLSGELNVECESEHNTGETEGTNKVNNVSVKFLGCKALSTIPCSNGPNEGEIQINPLKGQLGYINKAEKQVGILLTPKTSKGEFVRFNCGGAIGTVVGVGNESEGAYYKPEKTGGYDGIISSIAPVNQMTSTYTQVYTASGSPTFQNVPTKFEGKHIELLEDYLYLPEEPNTSDMWGPGGEEITNVNTAVEEGEIKA